MLTVLIRVTLSLEKQVLRVVRLRSDFFGGFHLHLMALDDWLLIIICLFFKYGDLVGQNTDCRC